MPNTNLELRSQSYTSAAISANNPEEVVSLSRAKAPKDQCCDYVSLVRREINGRKIMRLHAYAELLCAHANIFGQGCGMLEHHHLVDPIIMLIQSMYALVNRYDNAPACGMCNYLKQLSHTADKTLQQRCRAQLGLTLSHRSRRQ